ncbi:O-antigen ligase family protein [Pseudomonas sp. PDM13]|uniref:O-antigen ligase family protein n=1 Tax=Pseudomonas sp. PDM13 TaxID=2769255 RepID=UPI0021DF62B3|nr:O-antigen ligase family protein [Pseudomonas sp. PDM13]MCU9950695.1 O-antigen ligase family protein [Pseudomonas sp. PDM13]
MLVFTVRELFKSRNRAALMLPGVACLLVGIFLPTSKSYHQALIVLLWLPGLFLLWSEREALRSLAKCTLIHAVTVFLVWSLVTSLWASDGQGLQEGKYLFFIMLTLWGMFLIGSLPQHVLFNLLWYSSIIASLFAGYYWFRFYLVNGMPWEERLSGVGQLSHSILAAHVFGFFTMVLYGLRPRGIRQVILWGAALSMLFIYLLFAQSKGVWVAVMFSLVLTPIWGRWLLYKYVAVICVVAVVALYGFVPELITQRGMSYRPELFSAGVEMWKQSGFLLGTGLGDHYSLFLESIPAAFDHPHNFYLSVAIQVGLVGLIFWGMVWGGVVGHAWFARQLFLRRVILGVWVFSTVSLLSDGFNVWDKPREIWFLTWVPVGLMLMLWRSQAVSDKASPE